MITLQTVRRMGNDGMLDKNQLSKWKVKPATVPDCRQ